MKQTTQGRSLARLLGIVSTSLLLLASTNLQALTFDSGSDRSDGVLDFTWAIPPAGERRIIVFDPSDFMTFDPGTPGRTLDQDNDNVFHFTSIRIPAGVEVRLTAPKLNWAPVYWLSTGDITIDAGGVLDLEGSPGHSASSVGEGRFPAIPGPGGFPGGVGASATNAAQSGFGPGGGKTTSIDFGGGAGSHATYGRTYNTFQVGGVPGDLYGSPFLLPLVGGSGGAGGGNDSTSQQTTRPGGGAGGGAILLASSTQIILDGAIDARGGISGGSSTTDGGGGSGGAVRIIAPIFKGNPYNRTFSKYTGWIDVYGGNYATFADGGYGRIRIEVFENLYRGALLPDTAFSVRVGGLVPLTPFLPSDNRVPGWPSVRVTTIDSVAVSAEPTGSFSVPDATVSVTTELPVVFAAKNIPITATVKLHIYGPDFAPIEVSPAYVSGDAAQSTWQANVAFPAGVSRAYLQATWVP